MIYNAIIYIIKSTIKDNGIFNYMYACIILAHRSQNTHACAFQSVHKNEKLYKLVSTSETNIKITLYLYIL